MLIKSTSKVASDTGYTYTHVKRVLDGKATPSLDCARKLSTALGITLDEFVSHLDAGSFITGHYGIKPITLWPLDG